MMAGTSPGIVQLGSGGWEATFEANTGHLWTVGSAGGGDTGLAMASSTNPSIAALAHGGYEVAFKCSDGNLCVYGSAGTNDTGLTMASGTSPSIAGLASGGYEVSFQAEPPPPAPVITQPVPSPVPQPGGRRHLRVKILLSWTWNHRRTRLTKVRMSRLPRSARIRILCHGAGCPRHAQTVVSRKLRRLEKATEGHVYRAGDIVFIRITARGYRAEQVRILIRDGTLPAIRLL